MEVYKNLKDCRTAAGLTQEQAAEKLCVTRQTISSYERGRTQADLDTLHRLAEIYGVTVERLLYGEESGKKTHHLEKAALAVFIGYFLWLAVSFGMMWWISVYLQIPGATPGHSVPITEELRPLVEMRFAMRAKADSIFRMGATVFKAVLLALTCWDISLGSQGKAKPRLVWAVLYLLAACGLVLLFGGADPVFQVADYFWQATAVILPALLFCFLLDLGFFLWRKKRRKPSGGRLS